MRPVTGHAGTMTGENPPTVRRAEASEAHLVAGVLHDFNAEFITPTATDELYARPHRRGSGVGTALVAALVAWVEEVGVGELHINVDESDVDARRFYERHGFTNLEVMGDGTSRMFLYQREF